MNSHFKETIKYLKPHPINKNCFYLKEAHLLYLSESQSKTYLDAMESPDYSNTFHTDVEEIISKNLNEMFHNNYKEISILDLGPGYPDKTIPIVKYFQSENVPINYYPIDINLYFLDLASKTIKPYARNVVPINKKFEECANCIPKEAYNAEVFCLIGLTFMNFEPKKIIELLIKISNFNGTIILASELVAKQNTIENILKNYETDAAKQVAFGPLSNLGLKIEDTEYVVEFNNSCVEMGFILKKSTPELVEHGLGIGSKIISAISFRYNEEDLHKLLSSYFKDITFFKSEDERTVVATCRKVASVIK